MHGVPYRFRRLWQCRWLDRRTGKCIDGGRDLLLWEEVCFRSYAYSDRTGQGRKESRQRKTAGTQNRTAGRAIEAAEPPNLIGENNGSKHRQVQQKKKPRQRAASRHGERVKGWQRDRQIDSLERDSDSKTSRREEQNGENE